MKNEILQKAYAAAKAVREKAHAPYSRFLVGAALKISGTDEFVVGCNIENASFGATVCAERVALWTWASQKNRESDKIEFVLLVTDTSSPVAGPCGLCLQTLSEFVAPTTPFFLANLQGLQKEVLFKDLFPYSFSLTRS